MLQIIKDAAEEKTEPDPQAPAGDSPSSGKTPPPKEAKTKEEEGTVDTELPPPEPIEKTEPNIPEPPQEETIEEKREFPKEEIVEEKGEKELEETVLISEQPVETV